MLLAISSLTIIFAILTQTINSILQGYGNAKAPVVALILGVIVKIFANIFLMPIAGVYENGAAIGSVLCHITSFIFVYVVLLKTIGFKFSILRLSIRPILATIIMILSSYGIYKLLISVISIKVSTIIAIFVAVIVFGFSVLFLRIFSKEEIQTLPNGEKAYKILKKMKFCD